MVWSVYGALKLELNTSTVRRRVMMVQTRQVYQNYHLDPHLLSFYYRYQQMVLPIAIVLRLYLYTWRIWTEGMNMKRVCAVVPFICSSQYPSVLLTFLSVRVTSILHKAAKCGTYGRREQSGQNWSRSVTLLHYRRLHYTKPTSAENNCVIAISMERFGTPHKLLTDPQILLLFDVVRGPMNQLRCRQRTVWIPVNRSTAA